MFKTLLLSGGILGLCALLTGCITHTESAARIVDPLDPGYIRGG